MATIKQSCRYYRANFPQQDDIVMANVKRIEDMGAYCSLLEYNDKEGMILMSEVSRRRIRSLNKHLRVGRNECVIVIRVDEDKGYIDLSKRRVSPEEAEKFQAKFVKAKAVNQILRHVAETLDLETSEDFESLYEKTAWAIDDKYEQKGACYEVFKKAAINPEVLNILKIDATLMDALLKCIKRRLTPQPVKLHATIELNCFTFEGIEAIKHALREGLVFSTPEMPIKINLIAPPKYVISTTTMDQTEGIYKVRSAMHAIKEAIEDKNGIYNVVNELKVTTEHDDKELEVELKQEEMANREVAGDDDNSDSN